MRKQWKALLVMTVLLIVSAGFPVFAEPATITVTRKMPETGENGYLLLEGVNEDFFTYPETGLYPGCKATGAIEFCLKPGIRPMEARISVTNEGDAEIFNGMDLKITRDSTVVYNAKLKDLKNIVLGILMNDSSNDLPVVYSMELSMPKTKSVNGLQNKNLCFTVEVTGDMLDYIAVKPDGASSGSIEIYQSLYNNRYYFTATGVPALESQHNQYNRQSQTVSVTYDPDIEIFAGADKAIGTKDDYYVDKADGLKVFPGPDNKFGTADDRKQLIISDGVKKGSNVERGSNEFGGSGYLAGTHYTDGADDHVPGTDDDQIIRKGIDGIYGTKDDLVDRGDRSNLRPGVDLIWNTEDDELWHNGSDGIAGNKDDTLLGYPYKKGKKTDGSSSGFGSSLVSGNSDTYTSPVAFAKAVEGTWSQTTDGKWQFTYNGSLVKSKWMNIHSKANDTNDWYYFDGSGIMQTGWQKSGNGTWYRLRTVNDSRYGAMEKGLFFEPEDGNYYYLDPVTGVMQTGWIKINDRYCNFAETSGKQAWFWNSSLGKWAYNALYGKPVGAMYVNEKTPDGWIVDKTGARVKRADS